MGFKTGNDVHYLNDGIPYVWGKGDETTAPSNQVKIKASDGVASDRFGGSVAVGCGRIVVGSYLDDDVASSTGSAYIYDLNGTQLAKIKPSDPAASDFFGWSVAIGSGRIVVGAYGDDDLGSTSGSAYIFNLGGTQLAKIKASDGAASDNFGDTVAIGSGRIVVGAYGDDDLGSSSGSAYIYNLGGTQLAKIKASDGAASDFFSRGSAVAAGCEIIVVGAYGDASSRGAAYIYDLSGRQIKKIVASDGAASDFFGRAVAVGSGRIVVGAYGDDDLGSSSGSAYIYDLNGTQLVKIKAPDGAASDNFGYSVAVGSGRIVVGAYTDNSRGSVYVYDLDGGYIANITASDGATGDEYGARVAVNNGRIVVGSWLDDDLGSSSGSAYIYTTPNVYTIYDAISYQRGEL